MANLYKAHFIKNAKSQLTYKTSFILGFLSQFLTLASTYFWIYALFNKFNNINGFSMYHIVLCYAIINFGFSFNEVFFRGIDRFEDLIIDGRLDRFFVRPQSIIYQAICSKIQLVKTSKLIQTLFLIILALIKLKVKISLMNILIIIMMLFSTILLFFSTFLLTSSYCFITIQGLEIKNVLTDGTKHMGQYPTGIYNKVFLFFFSFIVPVASVNYYPLLYLIGKSNNIIYLFSPLLVIIYFLVAFNIFKIGLKHYSSTGS